MRRSASVLLALIMAVQSGCATLLKGSNEQVMITSYPAGAKVSLNGQNQGTTPYVANVPSSQDLDIQLSKPGYQAASIKDDTSLRWGYEIWSFVAFVIPLGVDMADGAAWGHDQTMVAAHMDPVVSP
jgi:PEGA domain